MSETEIQPVKRIFCVAVQANGGLIEVIAQHSDDTVHTLGKFRTREEAEKASAVWKQKYRLPNITTPKLIPGSPTSPRIN
jgi:hypothetical protein